MVEVQNNKNIIKVQVKGNQCIANQVLNLDTVPYYNNLAKTWAIKTDGKVDEIDFSSKYYALKSLESSDIAISAKDSILTNSDFQKVAGDLKGENNIKTCSDNISEIQNAKANANIATNAAQIATEKAQLVTETLENSANKSLSNLTEEGIEFLKNNACHWGKVQGDLTKQSDLSENLELRLLKDHSNDTKPYITEVYQNGNSWYRVWSDNWCEQGGFVPSTIFGSGSTANIMFLKEYQENFVYHVSLEYPSSKHLPVCWGYTYFTTNITVQCSTNSPHCSWYTCGYIK